ncbi:MAG: DUF2461 domain-containing protein [Acidobacteria bacterium]|nr:DUF2461 domain-containing protein [Acidobacteriota bacterium]
MTSPFSPKTLAFLRTLARHNDRDWFRLHKPEYDAHVRGPIVDLIARLAVDLRAFAPELIADPRVSLYRVYRDTRFSADKSPLKTHVAGHFPSKDLSRGRGAALYLEVSPRRVRIGGGLYMPAPSDLRLIREHIASRHRALHRMVVGKAFREAVGALSGAKLASAPKGYAVTHPAIAYLRFKQFLAGRELEPGVATTDSFYPELLRTFRAVAPLVRFLNAPLIAGAPAGLSDIPFVRRR